MTREQFDYFYKEFDQLNYLSDLVNIAKLRPKTRDNVFEAYKKSNNFNDLKKKVINELSKINSEWTKGYTDYDNHPTRMLPFPEIYDLTELDEKNFNFFFKEYEKLETLFHQAYHINEDKSFDNIEDDEDGKNSIPSQLDEKNETKLKGFIGNYYSVDSVIEYNRQEEKITNELAKINQKWLEAKSETRLTRYEGDFKVTKFVFPYIYTLFEKLVKNDIEIQKLKLERSNSHTIEKKQYDSDKLKEEILEMD